VGFIVLLSGFLKKNGCFFGLGPISSTLAGIGN